MTIWVLSSAACAPKAKKQSGAQAKAAGRSLARPLCNRTLPISYRPSGRFRLLVVSDVAVMMAIGLAGFRGLAAEVEARLLRIAHRPGAGLAADMARDPLRCLLRRGRRRF